MKRTAEQVLGIIGACTGLVISILFFSFIRAIESYISGPLPYMLFMLFVFMHAAALVLSIMVNRISSNWFGGLLITFGVLSFPVSILFFFFPSVLYFIAGGLGFRKLKAAAPAGGSTAAVQVPSRSEPGYDGSSEQAPNGSEPPKQEPEPEAKPVPPENLGNPDMPESNSEESGMEKTNQDDDSFQMPSHWTGETLYSQNEADVTRENSGTGRKAGDEEKD